MNYRQVINTVSIAYQVIRKEIRSKKGKYTLENKLKILDFKNYPLM